MAILKALLPGSIPFLLIALALGLLLLHWPRMRQLGRLWLWGLFGLYLFFSLPAGSRWLAAPLGWGFEPLQSTERARGAQAVVVLDGGTQRYQHSDRLIEVPLASSALRTLEALRVCRLIGQPLVIVSGGDENADPEWAPEASVIRHELIRGGVPTDRIVLDSSSVNTRAHAVNLVGLLRDRGISQFVLVTSPTHIRRAILAFRAAGVEPVPSPSPGLLDDRHGWRVVWPSPKSLEHTQEAMHEYVGLVYYSLRHFI